MVEGRVYNVTFNNKYCNDLVADEVRLSNKLENQNLDCYIHCCLNVLKMPIQSEKTWYMDKETKSGNKIAKIS